MSQISKLKYVNAELGAPTGGQQTTRVLYHTLLNASGNTNVFFKQFQGLTLGQTNLNQNKLDSAESMVIKTISFQRVNGAELFPFANGGGCTFSIIVGNQKVVKDLPITFNTGATGQPFDRLHNSGASGQNTGQGPAQTRYAPPAEIRFITDIVIPPQTEFYVEVSGGGFGGNTLTCALAGYGKIFSAGSSF